MKQIYHKIIGIKEEFLDWIVFKFFNPYKINPAGCCPVQSETILPTGEWCYFRARGSQWSLEIYPKEEYFADTNKRIYNYIDKNYKKWPECGWLSKRECIRLATKAINKYYEK